MDWLLVLVAAALVLMLVGAVGVPRTLARCEPAAARGPWRRTPFRRRQARRRTMRPKCWNYLRRLEAQASPGLAADVIEIFLQDTSDRLTALRQRDRPGDGETVFRVAHTLQGSAAMIGAASVARGCALWQEVRAAGRSINVKSLLRSSMRASK